MAYDAPQTVASWDWQTANDSPERDPTKWTLEGSNDGFTWTVLDNAHSSVAFSTTSARFTWQGPFIVAGRGGGGCADSIGGFTGLAANGPLANNPAASGSSSTSCVYTGFKFNLDPAGDHTGLRSWSNANSVQLAEITLFDSAGNALRNGLTCRNAFGNSPDGELAENACDGDSGRKSSPAEKLVVSS